MHAELAYLFRHALLRDAAYQLQLPGDRAKLHMLAADVLEDLYGAPVDCGAGLGNFTPLPIDPYTDEICEHLETALAGFPSRTSARQQRKRLALHLRRAAHYCYEQFRFVDAADRFERLGREFGKYIDDAPGELLNAATAALTAFDKCRAEQLCRAAMALARKQRNLKWRARAMSLQGRLVQDKRGNRYAAKLLDAAMAIQRKIGDEDGLIQSTSRRGYLAGQCNETALGEKMYTEALQLSRKLRQVRSEGTALVNLATMRAQAGNPEQALETLREALELNRRHDNLRALGYTYTNFGAILDEQGRFPEAESAYLQALTIHKQIGNFFQAGIAENVLGKICERLNRLESALLHFSEAARFFAMTDEPSWEGGSRGEAAVMLQLLGRMEEAQREIVPALKLVRIGAQPGLEKKLIAKYERARSGHR